MPVLHKAVNSDGLCNSTDGQLLQRKHSLGHEAWRVCCLLSCKAFYDLTEKDLLAILGKLLLVILFQLWKIMVFLIRRWWIVGLWGAVLIVPEGMDLLASWGVKLLPQKLKFLSWQLCWKKAVALCFVVSVSISLEPRPYKICVKTSWIPGSEKQIAQLCEEARKCMVFGHLYMYRWHLFPRSWELAVTCTCLVVLLN